MTLARKLETLQRIISPEMYERKLEARRRERDRKVGYHHCWCMHLRERAGKKCSRTTRKPGVWEDFISLIPPDCGICDSTGWCT